MNIEMHFNKQIIFIEFKHSKKTLIFFKKRVRNNRENVKIILSFSFITSSTNIWIMTDFFLLKKLRVDCLTIEGVCFNPILKKGIEFGIF